jgi:hypothetical protein
VADNHPPSKAYGPGRYCPSDCFFLQGTSPMIEAGNFILVFPSLAQSGLGPSSVCAGYSAGKAVGCFVDHSRLRLPMAQCGRLQIWCEVLPQYAQRPFWASSIHITSASVCLPCEFRSLARLSRCSLAFIARPCGVDCHFRYSARFFPRSEARRCRSSAFSWSRCVLRHCWRHTSRQTIHWLVETYRSATCPLWQVSPLKYRFRPCARASARVIVAGAICEPHPFGIGQSRAGVASTRPARINA